MTKLFDMIKTDKIMFDLDILLYMEALQADIIGYLRLRNLFQQLSCLFFLFCGRVPWLYQYWPGGFMLFVVLCPGTPKGSTGIGSGFKASKKTGQRLNVSSDRLGEAGNQTCDPWFTRHRFIPYTTVASFSFWCQLHFKATALLQSH